MSNSLPKKCGVLRVGVVTRHDLLEHDQAWFQLVGLKKHL